MNILTISIKNNILQNIDLDEFLVSLEDKLNENIIIENVKEKDKTSIFIRNINKETNSLTDFIEEWKIIKTLGIEFKIFNDQNYKQFFSMTELPQKDNNQENIEDLDKFLTKVPKNDPKLVDILNQIKKKKK